MRFPATFGQQLIAEEAEGILAWLVVGLRRWMENGLRPPECMKAQREEWKAESDTLKQWMDAECVQDDSVKATSLQLHESYQQWRVVHKMYPQSTVMFARDMKEHGFQKKEFGDKKVPHWLGVGIKAKTR